MEEDAKQMYNLNFYMCQHRMSRSRGAILNGSTNRTNYPSQEEDAKQMYQLKFYMCQVGVQFNGSTREPNRPQLVQSGF